MLGVDGVSDSPRAVQYRSSAAYTGDGRDNGSQALGSCFVLHVGKHMSTYVSHNEYIEPDPAARSGTIAPLRARSTEGFAARLPSQLRPDAATVCTTSPRCGAGACVVRTPLTVTRYLSQANYPTHLPMSARCSMLYRIKVILSSSSRSNGPRLLVCT